MYFKTNKKKNYFKCQSGRTKVVCQERKYITIRQQVQEQGYFDK